MNGVIDRDRVHGHGRARLCWHGPGNGEDGMNAKRACLVALVMALAGFGVARAQQYGPGSSKSTGAPSALPAPSAEPGPTDAPMPPPTGPRLSDYILGSKPDCCGPMGGDGTIATEIYVRWGPSIVVMNGFLPKTLETGWEVQGGGRALFFNADNDAAWTIDLSLSDIGNQGQHTDRIATLHLLEPNATDKVAVPVTVRALNRTYANLGLGREWYLWDQAANCPSCGNMPGGCNWRVGFDAGGRWGTESMDFHEIKHRTEVIEALFVSVHSDVEIPWRGWVIVVGGRVEWDNTWMHTILQDAPENLQNINILMTLGVRY
jgi:hypothetical protein